MLLLGVPGLAIGGGGSPAFAVGQTLAATTGTWGLPTPFSSGTNGTITYAYQWQRRVSGVWSNISTATSASYTLVEADSGNAVRCRVRGSNSGGYDPREDAFSNVVVVA
jgi:hypothetical protein